MSELAPCPFCGGEAYCEKKGNSVAHYVVLCKGCRVKMVGTKEADAVNAWNRRVVQPQPAVTIPPTVREALAAYAHEAWSGWMRYMFGKGQTRQISIDGGTQMFWLMPAEFFHRWQRQMKTEFSALPEQEKQSDYDEADKMLAIVREWLDQEANDA